VDVNEEFRNEVIKEIFSWVKLVVLTVAFALFFNFYIIVNAVIPSGSMERTIMTGDRIIAFRLSYVLSDPTRHDIIILPDPDNLRGDLLIKRIVGMPGETLYAVNGNIYIIPEGEYESQLLDEPFLQDNDPPRCNFSPVTVPEGAFFVLGDHRNNSMDSRHWFNQFVYEENILGRAIFRYYPGLQMLH